MSADIQHEYPLDISFATSSSVSFAEVDLSQVAFRNPGQLPRSQFKVESPSVSQPVFYADPGSRPFSNPCSSFPPHSLEGSSVSPVFVQPSEVMPPSPPTFAPVPILRVPGSSSPPGLAGDSDEDAVSDWEESEAADPSDAAEGVDDGDFIPSHMSPTCTFSPRTSNVSSGSGSVRAARTNRLGAPVPVPNLTKKSRGRRIPTAPVSMVQRMYKCSVEGCNKCFSRREHLEHHVRSIHTNETREFLPHFTFLCGLMTLRQWKSVLWKDAEGTLLGQITSDDICVCTRVEHSPATAEPCNVTQHYYTHDQIYIFFFSSFFLLPPSLLVSEGIVNDSGECEAGDPSDTAEGDDDRDFIPWLSHASPSPNCTGVRHQGSLLITFRSMDRMADTIAFGTDCTLLNKRREPPTVLSGLTDVKPQPLLDAPYLST